VTLGRAFEDESARCLTASSEAKLTVETGRLLADQIAVKREELGDGVEALARAAVTRTSPL